MSAPTATSPTRRRKSKGAAGPSTSTGSAQQTTPDRSTLQPAGTLGQPVPSRPIKRGSIGGLPSRGVPEAGGGSRQGAQGPPTGSSKGQGSQASGSSSGGGGRRVSGSAGGGRGSSGSGGGGSPPNPGGGGTPAGGGGRGGGGGGRSGSGGQGGGSGGGRGGGEGGGLGGGGNGGGQGGGSGGGGGRGGRGGGGPPSPGGGGPPPRRDGDGGGDGQANIRDEPDPLMAPNLAERAAGQDPEVELQIKRATGANISNTDRIKARLRAQRMTRPVVDPNYHLVNYGHRSWPIQQDPRRFLNNVMATLWPGGNAPTSNWETDQHFSPRLRRVVDEFNTYGLPRTIHAKLDHETTNHPPEVINPSYRCPCWIELLGETWYNDTDASILRRLGPGWIINGQPLLIHLLTRIVTAMTQEYVKNSTTEFKYHNPSLTKAQSIKWPDQATRILEKMLELKGFEPSHGKNLNLAEEYRNYVAGLSGMLKTQVTKKLQNMRAADKKLHGQPPPAGAVVENRPRPAPGPPFDLDEMFFLDCYLLKEKILDPSFQPKNVPEKVRADFISRIAKNPNDPTLHVKIGNYVIHYVSETARSTANRKGFKQRSEAIAYYNIIAASQGGQPYDPIHKEANNLEWCKTAVDQEIQQLTIRLQQLQQGAAGAPTDYEARDTAAIIQAAENAAVAGEQAEGDQGGAGPSVSPALSTGSPMNMSPLQLSRAPGYGAPLSPLGDICGWDIPVVTGEVDLAMANFGPGSPQEQIQTILYDQLTGPDRSLTVPSFETLLAMELPPSPERRAAVPPVAPSPGVAFPDIYDEIYREHVDRLRRSQSPAPDHNLAGGSTRASREATPESGGRQQPVTPPGSPAPPLWNDPRRARFNLFYSDVQQHFPDMLPLIKPPIGVRDFHQIIGSLCPSMVRYINLPSDPPSPAQDQL